MWTSSRSALWLSLVSLLPSTLAQTWTSCDPRNGTCPSDPALGMNATFNMNSSSHPDTGVWNQTSGLLSYTTQDPEAGFQIEKQGDSPTIQSAFYIFGGRVSVIMRAATGQGIVSSIVLESDDLDEVDWEFLGGDRQHVQTNFFGKGNSTTYDRSKSFTLPDGSPPQDDFHNYTVVWQKSSIDWYIDNQHVRNLTPDDPTCLGGTQFPQTPMYVKIGIWAGGDPAENEPGVVEWAGGHTDYTQGPFTMYVKQVEVVDFSTGASSYTYGDQTGSWDSIKIEK
jgi:beta-glucanase (GH16 family)